MSNLLQRILKYVEQEKHIASSPGRRRSWYSKLNFCEILRVWFILFKMIDKLEVSPVGEGVSIL